MYNSINHFIEFGVKNIEKKVKNFVCNGGDLADLVLNLKEDVFELVRNILQEVIEDMDYLRVYCYRIGFHKHSSCSAGQGICH
jgi:hypothetical protein